MAAVVCLHFPESDNAYSLQDLHPVSCLSGHDGACLNGQISGYYTPGTFQQYTLGPANYVTRIPDGLESAAAAPMLCGGVTTYAAIRKSGAKPGTWIAILGKHQSVESKANADHFS